MTRIASVLAAVLVAGCAVGNGDTVGGGNQFVTNSINMPSSVPEARELGFDLDGDPAASIDNHLGNVLSQIFQSDLGDLDASIRKLVNNGTILHLLEIDASDLERDSTASAALFVGLDTDNNPQDNWSGDELFMVDDYSTTSTWLEGHIRGGTLDVGPGTVTLKLALPGSETTVNLVLEGVRMIADIEDGYISGRIGGAVSVANLNSTLMPFISDAIVHLVQRDCSSSSCVGGSTGEFFIELFDTNLDGVVSPQEIENHPLVTLMTTPDVDLFDNSGSFSPGKDGVRDALSIGLGFAAVPARF